MQKSVLLVAIVALAAIGAGVSIREASTVSAARPVVDLPNYDIRMDKGSRSTLGSFRSAAGKTSAESVNFRERILQAEDLLRQSIPTLKIEFDRELGIPEVIAPDVAQGRAYLAPQARGKRSTALKTFLRGNADLIGMSSDAITDLEIAADYTNPNGELSFVELNQKINGIPVFRGEIKAGYSKNGELIRVIKNLAPALDHTGISEYFGDPSTAVASALEFIDQDDVSLDRPDNAERSSDTKVVFGQGDAAPEAEKIYFPTEPGVAVAAWRVLIWRPRDAFYVIVDAANHTLLWRKNITEDQTQSATYGVYANPDSMLGAASNPFPLSPAGSSAPDGSQGPPLPRTAISVIGNEARNGFNSLGWLTDGAMTTDGNAIQAGIDRDSTDGVDNGGEATSVSRDFTFVYNPLDPNTNTGDAPVVVPQTYPPTQFQQGAITHLFYVANRFHDEAYRLGFTEAARNFQNVNFSGQGLAGDRISGEVQDAQDVNNANFSTTADGTRGRMQMYIFNGANPDIDASLDSSVVVHELTHGLSSRLHGNSAGLFNDMSRGMGEGWSDFYALAMLSGPGQPADGIYPVAAYSTYLATSTGVNNNYYGTRRFPTAIRSSVGGPDNLPHNPLTFADIDSTQINIADSISGLELTATE